MREAPDTEIFLEKRLDLAFSSDATASSIHNWKLTISVPTTAFADGIVVIPVGAEPHIVKVRELRLGKRSRFLTGAKAMDVQRNARFTKGTFGLKKLLKRRKYVAIRLELWRRRRALSLALGTLFQKIEYSLALSARCTGSKDRRRWYSITINILHSVIPP